MPIFMPPSHHDDALLVCILNGILCLGKGGNVDHLACLLGRRRKPHRAPDTRLDRRVERELGAVARALGALGRARARRLVLPGPDAVALDLAVGAEAKRVGRVGLLLLGPRPT